VSDEFSTIARELGDFEAEDSLARMLASLVTASREFIGIADLEGNALFVNEAGRELVGLRDLEAVRSTRIIDYFPTDDHRQILDEVLPAVRDTGFWEGELKFRNFQTGQPIPVLYNIFPIRNSTSAIIAYGTVTRNLTESKSAEQRLRSLASIVESSDDAILSKNLDGIITSWNRGAERLFDYTAEEAIGQPITMIIPQDRLDEEREILARIGRGERIDHFETVRQRKHGGLISISLTVSPVKNTEGEIVGASKVARDITEQKLAWKTAELADRAKSSFLAAASHDLRQPLQALKLLQAALEPHHPSGEARKLVARIGQSLDTMTSILSSLLDVNRLESGNLSPSVSEFSLNEIYEPLAGDFAAPVLERGLRLSIVRSGLIIRSDRRMLAEMIRNLLSNAVRYTDRGRILLGCRRAGDNVRIEVWDSEDELPHIFHDYYQGTDGLKRGGFGLGLAIVKRLGEILDHKIEVRSISGKGTRFLIEVPRGRSSVKVPDAASPIHPRNDTFPGNVLTIEDEASVRAALRKSLKTKGVDATIVATAIEALTLIREQGLRPDVLLCDFNLRGSPNGVESIRQLRAALCQNVPAVVMTGDIRSQTVDSISAQGVSVLIKPFSTEELLDALRGQTPRVIIVNA
jgi:PAS domain S-box-containing protein